MMYNGKQVMFEKKASPLHSAFYADAFRTNQANSNDSFNNLGCNNHKLKIQRAKLTI